MSDIKITAMKRVDDETSNAARILANFEVLVHGMEIGGCTLARGERQGKIMTWAPRVTADKGTIRRYVKFADPALRHEVTKEAYAVYRALGGTCEGIISNPVPSAPTPKPTLSQRYEKALAAGGMERRVFPATFKIGTVNGKPIAEAKEEAERAIEAMDEASGVDDTEGLHRALGVEQAA